jgi:hypothetical protein
MQLRDVTTRIIRLVRINVSERMRGTHLDGPLGSIPHKLEIFQQDRLEAD